MMRPPFPAISPDRRAQMLRPRVGSPVRVVIDSDTANEIDDQFALTWALLRRDVLTIEAVYAAPYSFRHRLSNPRDGVDAAEGMERSYQEALTICRIMGVAVDVYRGSERYLTQSTEPVRSVAATHLVDLARKASAEDPLYVLAIGAPTNVASALLMNPEIIRNIVVVWTAGYPTRCPYPNAAFNLEQDLHASRLLFDSGVALVYLPGFHIGAQLRVSLPEIERWVRGYGEIGDYLYHLYTHNPLHAMKSIDDHFGRSSVIWDFINVAWLVEPAWVPSSLVRAPHLGDDKRWYRNEERHAIREALGIDRDAIFRDFFTRLQAFDGQPTP